MFYHCLKDEAEDDQRETQEDEDDEDGHGNGNYLGRSVYRQSISDTHHCDVIVLKTDNGWCFDQVN